MPSQITNFQCPSCTGPLHYEGSEGMLRCDYCGSGFTVQEIEALYADQMEQAAQAGQDAQAQVAYAEQDQVDAGPEPWDFDAAGSDWGSDGQGMKAYVCPSCAAELICDATTVATSCPYCGNPTVVPSQFVGYLKPDFIMPFKLSREDAIKALKAHYKGKKLLPKAFTDQNHIEEIRGVYVPFWLFDGAADTDMRFAANRVHTERHGNQVVTTTEHFQVHRSGYVDFSGIPVDASSLMPDQHMDSIEPFDYSELKPFSPAYLPGFLANKYDVDQEECSKRADRRAANTAEQLVANTVHGYASVTPTARSIHIRRGKVSYAMLPVYLLATRWKGERFLFAMNGQTGKFIGDLPVSRERYWSWFARIALPVTAAVAALLYFL